MQKTDAIQHFGSQKKLAEALGMKSQSAVSEWPEMVPLGRALQIEKITRGKLKVDLSTYEERAQ